MSTVLLKMHIAESYAKVLSVKDSIYIFNSQDTLLHYNEIILQEYKISKSDFKTSVNYYSKHPDLLDSIYQTMLSEIAILQSKNKKW